MMKMLKKFHAKKQEFSIYFSDLKMQIIMELFPLQQKFLNLQFWENKKTPIFSSLPYMHDRKQLVSLTAE